MLAHPNTCFAVGSASMPAVTFTHAGTTRLARGGAGVRGAGEGGKEEGKRGERYRWRGRVGKGNDGSYKGIATSTKSMLLMGDAVHVHDHSFPHSYTQSLACSLTHSPTHTLAYLLT